MIRSLLLLAATTAASAALACSNSSDASSSSGASSGTDGGGIVDCPDDIPATCPPVAPTFAKEVSPIFQTSCAVCHAPGGRVPDRQFVTYDAIYAQRGAILSQVNACRMPPRDGTALAPEARKALLAWLVCGAKND